MENREQEELLIQVRNAFANRTGIRMINVEKDRSEAELIISEDTMNPYGTVHGGALFTLADMCSGVAARSDGRIYVTEHADISYFRAVSEGKLIAKGSVLHRGRTSCVVDVKIFDSRNSLVCAGTFSFFCVQRSVK